MANELVNDPMLTDLSSSSHGTSTQSENSQQLSVIPGVGIMRYDHIEGEGSGSY